MVDSRRSGMEMEGLAGSGSSRDEVRLLVSSWFGRSVSVRWSCAGAGERWETS